MSDDSRLTRLDELQRDTLRELADKIRDAENHLAALRAEYQRKLDWIMELRARFTEMRARAFSERE